MQNPFDLTSIGATAEVFAAFESHAARGLTLGRVSAVHRDRYRVYTAAGEAVAEAIGALLYRAQSASELPAVGDWVAVQQVSGGHAGIPQAMIHAVLPRRTAYSRRAAGDRREEQVIAANVDVAMIVCGLDGDLNLRRIERYLILARESGSDAVVVLNKADLCPNVDARLADAARIAGGAGIAECVPVIVISARSSEGITPLLSFIGASQTIVLLGSSGVGKSTLMNQLLGCARQAVQEVRESDSRGRHTTTHRELVPLPRGGAIIDTPGMRELQLWAGEDSLNATFDEIGALAVDCRYRDCTHGVEEGCAVQAAIDCGALDPERWQSYQKLRAEIAWQDTKSDVLLAQKVKQRWKAIHKAMRVHKNRP